MAAKDNDDSKTEDQDAEISLDMSQAAVKKMIGEAREKGYITYDQLNQVLPPDQVSIDLAMGPDEDSRVAAVAASPELLNIFKQDFFG